MPTIIDLFDQKVVGYKISRCNNYKIVTDVLNEAIEKRKNVHGLIMHSDQRWQYASFEYEAICNAMSFKFLLSRVETLIDDLPIENWHSLPKKKLCLIMMLYQWNNMFNLLKSESSLITQLE